MTRHAHIWLWLALLCLASCGNPVPSGAASTGTAAPSLSAPTLPPASAAPASSAPTAPPAPTPTSLPAPTQPPTDAPTTPVPAIPTVMRVAPSPPQPVAPLADPAARLETAVPVEKAPPAGPRGIPIYGPGQAGGASTGEQRGEAVIGAAKKHLAGTLGAAESDMEVVESGPAEVAVAAPCGTGGDRPGQPVGEGLAVGYAVTLRASGQTYRYVAVGGLVYPCSAIS